MKTKIVYPSTLASVEDWYAYAQRINDGHTGPHLPRLRALAEGLPLAIEFGVRRGASSSALILGAQHVISYDITETPEARRLQALAGSRWTYYHGSSLEAPVQPCDLLFVDSLHTYLQCDAELRRHADSVGRWLVFHDSIWRGTIGEGTKDQDHRLVRHDDDRIRRKALGIRPAVDALMIRDRSWQIAASYDDACGLLVLERRQ